jgi:pSer/pThr/pTyr-binding forkhead associated (FHA) protein
MSSYNDAFALACGKTNATRLEVFWPDGSASASDFIRPFVLIGRDRRADLYLPDSHVSSRHLYLQLFDGRLFGVCLTDRATLTANGQAWKFGWLRAGDELACGPITLRILATGGRETDDPPTTTPITPTAGPPLFAFEPLASRSNPPRQFAYRQNLVIIGQSNPSDFRIHHPDVSRCHAALVQTPAGLWAVDLLSRVGLTVNGTRVAAAAVRDGDTLSFGRVSVRLRVPGEKPENSSSALVLGENQPLAPPPQMIEPILDQVAALQRQTFEQFQELLGTMMQMVSGMMNEQRAFLREELDRLERLTSSASQPSHSPQPPPPPPPKSLPAAPPAASAPPPATRPVAGRPQLDEVQLHAWLEQRLGTINKQQSAVWQRFVRMLKGG